MLTIPFSLVGAFTNGFWDNLESALAACTTPVNVTLGTLYDQYFNAVRHGHGNVRRRRLCDVVSGDWRRRRCTSAV